MAYRKVTYAEQIWYIIRFTFRQRFKRGRRRRKC